MVLKNRRLLSIFLIIGLLSFLFFVFKFNNFKIFSYSHILADFEISSFFLTLFIGILTFVMHYSKRTGCTLFISVGFAGLSGIHFSNVWFYESFLSIYIPSSFYAVASWSWFNSFLFLSLFLIAGSSIAKFKGEILNLKPAQEIPVYVFSLLLVVLNFLIFKFMPLPDIYSSNIQLITIINFFIIFVLHFSMKKWQTNYFNYFFLLAVCALIGSQVFMLFSVEIFDRMFDFAHILRIIGYALVLLGTFISIYETYKQEKYNEKKINSILQNMSDGVITVKENCIIESCNSAAEKLFKYPKKMMVGKTIDLLFPHNCRAGQQGQIMSQGCFIRDYVASTPDFRIKGNDGEELNVEVNINEIRIENERLFVFVVHDITHRKKVEKIKDEFISIVSHELRTPITSIRGSLGLILSGMLGSLPGKINEMINIANDNCIRLSNLIDDILDIEKIASGKMKFDLEGQEVMPVIHKALEINQPYADQYKARLVIREELPGAKVYVDTERLIQVLTNLFSNASKFTVPESFINIRVQKEENNIKVSVSNYSEKISNDIDNSIFDRFVQVDSSDKRVKGGTGLGLSICKSIIKKFDGDIWFDVNSDKKITFHFTLPEYIEQEEKKSRILICEDEADIASLINLVLTQQGYHTDIAYNLDRAKELLEQNKYDAITLDLIYPDKNENQVFEFIQNSENIQDMPVIVISIKAREEYLKEVIDKLFIIDWIKKPIDHKRLVDSVEKALSLKKDKTEEVKSLKGEG